MTEKEFRTVFPLMVDWIQKTLAEHATSAQPVASLGFSRLPHYYDETTLVSAKVVSVSRVPVPPLSAMGLDRFKDFERIDVAGITYLDTYFVREEHAHDESLHFHELVHVFSGGCLARRNSWRSTPMAWNGSAIVIVRWK